MKTLELNLDKLIDALSEKHGRKITQREVAEMAGIAEGQFSRYVHNRLTRVDLNTLGRLFEVFEIDPGPLFRIVEDKD